MKEINEKMIEQIITIEEMLYNGKRLTDLEMIEVDWVIDQSESNSKLLFDFLSILLRKAELGAQTIEKIKEKISRKFPEQKQKELFALLETNNKKS